MTPDGKKMCIRDSFKSDLYDHREDICRYGTLDQLRDMGVYAIRESLADEILSDLSYDEDYAPTDDAKDTIMGAVSAAFEERYGEDFAEVATDFGQDIDDIAGRANPCIPVSYTHLRHGDARQRSGAKYRPQCGLPHASQAVPARPYDCLLYTSRCV